MSVNQSFVGRVYPPEGVYEVGREKIREFAEAVAGAGPVHPAHVDPQAARELGHPDVIAPPTFAVVVAQRSDARLVRDPEAGIDFSRVVHGEQRFVHHRPVVAGDRLVATLHVDSVRGGNGGHAMVTTRSEIATEGGEAVCTATSTIVVRGEDA